MQESQSTSRFSRVGSFLFLFSSSHRCSVLIPIRLSGTPSPSVTLEEWDRIYAINARGTFLCYQYAAKQMIAQGRGGRIIGGSSDIGRASQSTITHHASFMQGALT